MRPSPLLQLMRTLPIPDRSPDRMPMAIIVLSLSNDHLTLVEGWCSPSPMWRELLNIHKRRTLLNHKHDRRKSYNVTMSPSKSMLTIKKRVRRFAATIPSVVLTIHDKEMATAPNNGLPDRLDHLISALDVLGSNKKDKMALDYVKTHL